MIRLWRAAWSARTRKASTMRGKQASGSTVRQYENTRMTRAPIREHADDARAREIGNLESTRREPRLIGEGMPGGEHILLEAGIDLRRIGQYALQQRRRDGDNLQAGAA